MQSILNELILAKGKPGLKLSEIQEKYGSILDFKAMSLLFLKLKKTPYYFSANDIKYTKFCKISCRWEVFREVHLGNFVLNNPPLNEICSQILRKIFNSGPLGISQHTIGSELGLKSADIHHHINNLIKFQLVKKKNFTVKSKSKLNNIIQLKCKIFENLDKKRYNCQEFTNKNEFSMINNLIKILSRFEQTVKQKDLKYGTMEKIDVGYREKRRFHRNWQKAKQKFFKAGINLNKLIQKNLISNKKKVFRKKLKNTNIFIFDEISWINFNKTNIFITIISFLLSPEIQIKKIMDRNYYSGVSSPFFLEKFKGYVNYKTIQFILKTLGEKRYLSKTLEQKGRQRIIKYQKLIELESEKEKKFKTGVTYQAANRRLILLSWVKSKVLLVKDLGRRIALKENKGLRKVDSKVIRRVLSDLIERNFLKIFKINIRVLNQKSRDIEVITRKEFDTTTFDFKGYLQDIHKTTNFMEKKQKTRKFFKFIKSHSMVLVLNLFSSWLNTNQLFSFVSNDSVKMSNNWNNFIKLISLSRKKFLESQKKRKTKFYSRFFFTQNKFSLSFKKKKPLEKIFFFLDYIILSEKKPEISEKHQYLTIYQNLTKNKCYRSLDQFQRNIEIKRKILTRNRNKKLRDKSEGFLFFRKKYIKKFQKKIKNLVLKKKKNILEAKLLEYKNFYFFFVKLIQIKDFNISILKVERWDSEIDINLLENFFIKKFRLKKKNSFFSRKKTINRRLNGILRVENIKIAISYLNKYFKFSHLGESIHFPFTPRNILKRCLELSPLEFCFNIQETTNIENLKIIYSENFFTDSLNKVSLKQTYFFEELKKNEFLTEKSLRKVNWILFLENYWKFEVKLNFEKKIFRINMNSSGKKRNEKKIEKNFMDNATKKKGFLKTLIFEGCRKIILFNFCLKFEDNLSHMIPFFLNEILKEDVSFSGKFYSTHNHETKINLNKERKFSKPLEVRNRISRSSYKKHFKDYCTQELNSTFLPLIVDKTVEIGFFEKMNYLIQHNKRFKILGNRYSNNLKLKISDRKFAIRKENLQLIKLFTCLKWTSLGYYYMSSTVSRKNFLSPHILLRQFDKNSRLDNKLNLKIKNGNLFTRDNTNDIILRGIKITLDDLNPFLSPINMKLKNFLKVKHFFKKKPCIKSRNLIIHSYFKTDIFLF